MSATVAEAATCQTMRGLRYRCGEPAELVAVGCIHEHVREVSACPAHQADIRQLRQICMPCFDHKAESHRCRVYLLRRPGS